MLAVLRTFHKPARVPAELHGDRLFGDIGSYEPRQKYEQHLPVVDKKFSVLVDEPDAQAFPNSAEPLRFLKLTAAHAKPIDLAAKRGAFDLFSHHLAWYEPPPLYRADYGNDRPRHSDDWYPHYGQPLRYAGNHPERRKDV